MKFKDYLKLEEIFAGSYGLNNPFVPDYSGLYLKRAEKDTSEKDSSMDNKIIGTEVEALNLEWESKEGQKLNEKVLVEKKFKNSLLEWLIQKVNKSRKEIWDLEVNI